MNKTEAEIPDSQPKDKPNPEKAAKRNREDKHRKKDDKSVAHVLKALSSLESTEEKLGAMCQKYAEMFNDHRILQDAAKVAERKNSILQKEKEQLQAEHSKAILTRSRLENLCRELQRQNKAVKEECMLKIREEEEKKREVAAKFHSTLTELGNLLAQNNDKNAKLRDDNLDMTTKLKNVCEQYEKKEQHVEKMAKQMHLEMQLANTKLAKAKMEMALEKEGLLRDNQQLLLELKEYKKQLEEMKTSEIALRNQIQLYNDKYDEFHKALLQSNEAIGSFKQEMERMAKQIRKLEKETVAWKRRYETTHRTLLQMTEEKIKSDETASVSERRLTALQGLCRSLQAQCNHLRGVVKAQEAAGNTVPAQSLSEDTSTTTSLVDEPQENPAEPTSSSTAAAAAAGNSVEEIVVVNDAPNVGESVVTTSTSDPSAALLLVQQHNIKVGKAVDEEEEEEQRSTIIDSGECSPSDPTENQLVENGSNIDQNDEPITMLVVESMNGPPIDDGDLEVEEEEVDVDDLVEVKPVENTENYRPVIISNGVANVDELVESINCCFVNSTNDHEEKKIPTSDEMVVVLQELENGAGGDDDASCLVSEEKVSSKKSVVYSTNNFSNSSEDSNDIVGNLISLVKINDEDIVVTTTTAAPAPTAASSVAVNIVEIDNISYINDRIEEEGEEEEIASEKKKSSTPAVADCTTNQQQQLQSSQQQQVFPVNQQQQGKKNKGKRKKNGAAATTSSSVVKSQ